MFFDLVDPLHHHDAVSYWRGEYGAFRPPAMGWFLGILQDMGITPDGVVLIQVALHVLTAYILYRHWKNPGLALMVLLSPMLIRLSGHLLSETLCIFLLALALYTRSGAVMALACLTRVTALAFIPFLNWKQIAICATLIGVYSLHAGTFICESNIGNIWLGTIYETAPPTPEPDRTRMMQLRAEGTRPAVQRAEVIEYVKAHPFKAMKRWIKSGLSYWGDPTYPEKIVCLMLLGRFLPDKRGWLVLGLLTLPIAITFNAWRFYAPVILAVGEIVSARKGEDDER